MKWSAEQVDQLIASWRAGHSAREIGQALGVTRDAVIGKANRLVKEGWLEPRFNPGTAARRRGRPPGRWGGAL